MRPPQRPGKPRSLGPGSERHNGGEISREQVRHVRQDAAPTSELSPDEARRIAESVTGRWKSEALPPSTSRHLSSQAQAELDRPNSAPEETGTVPSTEHTDPQAPNPERRSSWRSRRGSNSASALTTSAASSDDVSGSSTDQELDSWRGRWQGVSARFRRSPRESSTKDISQRRLEKKAERRRLMSKRLAVVGGSILLIVILIWVLFFSSILGLKTASVHVKGLDGETDVTVADIRGVMSQWEGAPTLRLPSGHIEAGLTDAFPLIKDASVSAQAPHGATVTLSMRDPVACLVVDKKCVAIDADGVELSMPQETASKLPHLTLGQGQEATGEAASAMIDVLGSLEKETRGRVDSIAVSDTLQVTLKLDSGAQVIWGRSEDNAFKAKVLAVLLTQEASSYDVSVPSAPVTG